MQTSTRLQVLNIRRLKPNSTSSLGALLVVVFIGALVFTLCVNAKDVTALSTNVIKNFLQFNTSGGWATGDKHGSYVANPFNIGQKAVLSSAGREIVVCPYEYQYTNSPANSGIVSTDMSILETGAEDDKYYRVTVVSGVQHVLLVYTHPPITDVNTYDSSFWTVSYTSPGSPANPTMYAVDAPGPDRADRESIMAEKNCNLFQGSITLTSKALYKGIGSDTVSHSFSYQCESNGGTTNWSVSP